jgi:hypothetical protein
MATLRVSRDVVRATSGARWSTEPRRSASGPHGARRDRLRRGGTDERQQGKFHFLDRKREHMTYRDAKTMTARGQIQYRFVQRAAKAIGSYQCLIVSADRRRGEMLERAACDGGWKTCVCVDARTALEHLSRAFVHLAVVDLHEQNLAAFRPVLEQLASRGGLLLIVCGNEGNPEEEVWVRQLGAWLYLPGVTETSNLALLCGEARQIAERIARVPAPDRSGRATAGRESYS